MQLPVVVEILRGGRVESAHIGSGAVLDADGAVRLSFGDIETPVFPRSAVKAFQALPLFERGVADRFALTDSEVALTVASHQGEPRHVETALGMLAKAGGRISDLACGVHWPSRPEASYELARSGAEPSALHNNCSGKHAGFLCLACGEGWPFGGYEQFEHPVQREVKAALETMTSESLDERRRGLDGCSIPTWAISLKGLAQGFARFGSGQGLAPARAAAAGRIRAAVAAQPFFVAGTGNFDTEAMQLLGERLFVKTGAEGVYCAALPELGLGIAVKAPDGAKRAAQAMIAVLIGKLLSMDDATRTAFDLLTFRPMTNWRGLEVGSMRVAGPLA